MAIFLVNTPRNLALAAAALLLSAGLAAAGAGRMGPRPLLLNFDSIDANGDGALSAAEITASGQARFADSDLNGDGLLDRGELEASMRARLEERRARAPGAVPDNAAARIAWMAEGVILFRDKDGDGLVSAAEMQARPERMARLIARLDQNGDGALSREELAARR